MYLTLSGSPPHLTRNAAKVHRLHPSPGSSTGLMCLKLPRCRARSQPAHDSCGCWRETTTTTTTTTTTLIPQLKQLQHRQQSISHRGSWTQVLHEKVHPSVLIFRAAPRHGYKFLPTKIIQPSSSNFSMQHGTCSPAAMPDPGFTSSGTKHSSSTINGSTGDAKAEVNRIHPPS